MGPLAVSHTAAVTIEPVACIATADNGALTLDVQPKSVIVIVIAFSEHLQQAHDRQIVDADVRTGRSSRSQRISSTAPVIASAVTNARKNAIVWLARSSLRLLVGPPADGILERCPDRGCTVVSNERSARAGRDDQSEILISDSGRHSTEESRWSRLARSAAPNRATQQQKSRAGTTSWPRSLRDVL